ncbi:MAG: hydroxymethylbilane synthase [Thermoanaerobaculia bacterium]|jgi:hydroxymethylbilane synthase
MNPIRIGSRGSKLALWQANEVQRLLAEAGHASEIVIFKTTGDKRTDVSLATIGGKGLFIKELEEALDRGEVDIAVHSLKDVPSIIPEQFELVSFLERNDPRDAWIQGSAKSLRDLPAGARIGTGSPRRRTQIMQLRPDVEVMELRGNVDTRLGKLRDGQYDGILLASAGLNRLGLAGEITSLFPLEEITPAAGQGIVGIEILASQNDLREALAKINHHRSALQARIERGVLQRFGTLLDCYTPVAVHAEYRGDAVRCHAFLSNLKGDVAIRVVDESPIADADALVVRVHEKLCDKGAMALIEPGPAA